MDFAHSRWLISIFCHTVIQSMILTEPHLFNSVLSVSHIGFAVKASFTSIHVRHRMKKKDVPRAIIKPS